MIVFCLKLWGARLREYLRVYAPKGKKGGCALTRGARLVASIQYKVKDITPIFYSEKGAAVVAYSCSDMLSAYLLSNENEGCASNQMLFPIALH